MTRLPDFGALPDSQIESLIQQLQALLKERAEQREAEALLAIREIAEKAGLDPQKVAAQFNVGRRSPAPKKRGRTKEPKYKDPVSGATWAGCGKRPRWISEALEEGANLEDFRIRES